MYEPKMNPVFVFESVFNANFGRMKFDSNFFFKIKTKTPKIKQEVHKSKYWPDSLMTSNAIYKQHSIYWIGFHSNLNGAIAGNAAEERKWTHLNNSTNQMAVDFNAILRLMVRVQNVRDRNNIVCITSISILLLFGIVHACLYLFMPLLTYQI